MSGWFVSVKAQLGVLQLDVDLRGESKPVALVGPNGSGKTTLLHIISGAISQARGEIEVNGSVLFSSARGINRPTEERGVGYVPQGYGLFPHLRAVDNVAFGLSTGKRRVSQTTRRRLARSMLEELECLDLAERRPRHLSGGEQQRVALARALLIKPSLLLLDEPLSALDAGGRRRVRSFLAARLLSLKTPSLVVTHDARDVAALDAQVAVLEAGRIVQQGSIQQLRAAPATEFVAEFVGDQLPHCPQQS